MNDELLGFLRTLAKAPLSEESVAVVNEVCGSLVMQEDCSYCLSNEFNQAGLCGWCVATRMCMPFQLAQDCLAAAANMNEPPERAWIFGEGGLDLCPPQASAVAWGRFSCIAAENQDCFVCLNDGACVWCTKPLEGLGIPSENSVVEDDPWAPNRPRYGSSAGMCMSLQASVNFCAIENVVDTTVYCQQRNAEGAVVLPDIDILYTQNQKVAWAFIAGGTVFPFVVVLVLLVTARGCMWAFSPKTPPLELPAPAESQRTQSVVSDVSCSVSWKEE